MSLITALLPCLSKPVLALLWRDDCLHFISLLHSLSQSNSARVVSAVAGRVFDVYLKSTRRACAKHRATLKQTTNIATNQLKLRSTVRDTVDTALRVSLQTEQHVHELVHILHYVCYSVVQEI